MGRQFYFLPVLLVALLFVAPRQGAFYEKLYYVATDLPALVHETGESVLALGYNETPSAPSTLWIGGIQNSYFPTYGDYERSAFTCAGASRPRRILIIGLGGSNTAYFLTRMPGVEEITIVELMEDLGALLNTYVPVAQSAFADPRVHYVADDGRRYLYANPNEKYDMIFIDPLYSFTAGHNNLYSREAMELYRSHLADGGIFCGWMNERHTIPATAANVFPYLEQFRDWVVAGNHPIEFDREYMTVGYTSYTESSAGIFADAVRDALKPEIIFSQYIGDRTCTLEKDNDTPILTDNTPRLEYYYFSPPSRRPIRCD